MNLPEEGGMMERTQLRTAPLGETGLEISRAGLGAWAIGGGGYSWGWGTQDDDDSVAAIHRALELGVNWIDTAAQYGFGHSEQIVGRAIADLAERPFVFTKGGQPEGPNRTTLRSLKRDSLRRELEGSLSRLRIDAIDLYQIHWPVPGENEEGWSALVEFKEEGLVRHIGVSNFDVEELRKIQQIAPVETLQPQYSLITRGVEDEILPFAEREGIGVIIYSPMGSGLLTGAMTRGRIASLADDDWASARLTFPGAAPLGEPRPRRTAAGGRRPSRHERRLGGRGLDAGEPGCRRRDRRLPPARTGRSDRRRDQPRAQ
jgi:aryl-alcohol dehydrogenase-like predicted oxidoreductase